MLPNLSVLEKKCKSLGLTVTIGKRAAKEPYVQALRQFYLNQDYPNGLPYEEISPMLCFQEWNLKPEEASGIWRNPQWVAQQKFNGCRVICHFVAGVGIFAQTRNVSLKNFRYQNITGSLLFRDSTPQFTATVDTEIMIEKPVDTRGYGTAKDKGEVTKSSLHSTTAVLHLESNQARRLQQDQNAPFMFKTFDILKWGGLDLKGRVLEEREKYRSLFSDTLEGTLPEVKRYFEFPQLEHGDKRAFHNGILSAGGEGTILKNLRSTYNANTSRDRSAWIKVKKRKEYDAFVTGFIRGEEDGAYRNLVGALEFSVKLEGTEKTHVLAMCSNLELEYRKAISRYDETTDTVTMVPEMYGKVAEVSGQDISARVYRLSHATLDRWRDGEGDRKTKDECTVNFQDLVQAAEWVG